MSHLTLHFDINTEKIDMSQEIEVWPEMQIKLPQMDYSQPSLQQHSLQQQNSL